MFCYKNLPKQGIASMITLSELAVYFDTFICAHFFTINTKLQMLSMLASNVLSFTAANQLPPVGLNLMITNYHPQMKFGAR